MEESSKRLTKGAWSTEEDSLLRLCIDKYGEGKWHQVPLKVGLNRCRKSCRLRWLNYLKPNIKRGKLESDEVDLVLRLHKLLGNRWSLIAGRLPGRTANDIKNYWNTHLSKKHEPCRKTKIKNKTVTSSSTIPVRKMNIFKPRPRSFTVTNGCNHLNDLREVDFTTPPCPRDSKNNGYYENGTTCNKDKEINVLVNNLMDGDNMWLENLLEEGQEGEEKKEMWTFDVDQLWSMLDGELD
ncbi:unnamed protein product [Cochlearia groenlandica]